MADSYTKLFGTITDSTIWSESDATRIVWITMLAMCDKDGIVSAAVPGLAARARVGMPECISALKKFLSPDQWSRTPDHEGRRIEVVPGGWRLLNHAKYRAIMSAETRREQSRVSMQKLRDEAKKASTVSNSLAIVSNVDGALTMLTHTDTYSDTNTNTNTKADTNTGERQNTDCAAGAATLVITPKRVTTPECPHAEIIELYHELLPMCPRVRAWTAARQKALRARWGEDDSRQSLRYWGHLFLYVASSDFLCGRSQASPGREPFLASLEWIAKSGNFVNIIEGKYHSGSKL